MWSCMRCVRLCASSQAPNNWVNPHQRDARACTPPVHPEYCVLRDLISLALSRYLPPRNYKRYHLDRIQRYLSHSLQRTFRGICSSPYENPSYTSTGSLDSVIAAPTTRKTCTPHPTRIVPPHTLALYCSVWYTQCTCRHLVMSMPSHNYVGWLHHKDTQDADRANLDRAGVLSHLAVVCMALAQRTIRIRCNFLGQRGAPQRGAADEDARHGTSSGTTTPDRNRQCFPEQIMCALAVGLVSSRGIWRVTPDATSSSIV